MDEVIQQSVEKYVTNALIHGEASQEGDFKRGNAAYHGIVAALKELRAAGEDGRQALLDVLHHESDAVTCWAATHLLKTDKKKAIKVLRAISRRPGIIGSDASTVLEELKKGRLETP